MRRLTVAALSLALVMSVGEARALQSSGAASASAPDAIYCIVQDARSRRVYYSEVFAGDYADMQGYRQAFHGWIDGRYRETSAGATALCFYESTAREARAAADRKAAEDRLDGYRVVWTRWAG